jgi:hypothetical protein
VESRIRDPFTPFTPKRIHGVRQRDKRNAKMRGTFMKRSEGQRKIQEREMLSTRDLYYE